MRTYLLNANGDYPDTPHPAVRADPQVGIFPDRSVKVRGVALLYGEDPDGNLVPVRVNASGHVIIAGGVGGTGVSLYAGTGNPNMVQTGNEGDVFVQTDGAGALWSKTAGSGNGNKTGWAPNY